MIDQNDTSAEQSPKPQEEFRRNQLYLKAILESSDEIVIRAVDRDYCFLFFNNAYKNDIKRMYGIDIAIGRNLLDGIPLESDRLKIKGLYDRAFSGESYASIDTYGENGSYYYENFFQPVRDERESIIGGISFGINITGRMRAEEALRQSEDLYRTLFMSITDGFYLSEVLRDDRGNPCDYRYLEVNPTFERILGLDRERIIGKRYKEIVPVDTTQWLDNYLRVAGTGEPNTFEFYSEEYKKFFETYAYKTAQGHIAVFVRDVTERKNTEKALVNIQKLESLGTLAGGIAHDFNNMLGGLFGCVDLAAAALESGNIQQAGRKLSDAMQSLDMLRSLTGQLLTFSKGGAPRRTVVPIEPSIKNSAMLAISGSAITCRFDLEPDLMGCDCDKNQITQVLTNIIINAKQAMPAGGEVFIAARNAILRPHEKAGLLQGGDFIRISIKDHGIGIPGDIIKNIFDPFFTTKKTGHGLGLSTAFSIVKRHEGLIEVESEPGLGTTFHVYLPAAPIENKTTREVPSQPYRGTGPILVMDDDESIRSIYRQMIALTGHSVMEAKNGEEAVQVFKASIENNRRIVMSLLDLTIKGGKGGRETLLEIRKLQPDAIVVAASGYANDPVMSDPEKNGFNDRLPKPFTREDLTGLLLRVFPK